MTPPERRSRGSQDGSAAPPWRPSSRSTSLVSARKPLRDTLAARSARCLLTSHPAFPAYLSIFLMFLCVSPVWAAAERREPVDADKNGKPEEWKVYLPAGRQGDGDTLVRIERDRDGDGTAEILIFLEKGQPVRSEVDRNKDGKPDVIRWTQDGKPFREQADLDFDGRADGWIFYKDGVKDLMIMDKNHDGRPDAWFYYGQGGLKLVGGRMDEDFDGKTERTWGTFPDKEARKPW